MTNVKVLLFTVTSAVVPKQRSYACETWNLYHFPFKSFNQCESFFADKEINGQSNGQTDRAKPYALNLSMPGGCGCGGRRAEQS